MKTFSNALLFGAALAFGISLSTASATTIVSGEADYVGHFTGIPAFTLNTALSETHFDTGWISSEASGSGHWTLANDRAERTDQNQLINRGIGIAFNKDGITQSQGVISFDYNLSTGSSNADASTYYLFGITDSTNFDIQLNNDASPTPPATTNLTLIHSAELNTSAGNETTSGTYTSPVLNLDPSSYDGYVFALYAQDVPGESYFDNATLTMIPEPGAGALFLGTAGALLLMRRRRPQ